MKRLLLLVVVNVGNPGLNFVDAVVEVVVIVAGVFNVVSDAVVEFFGIINFFGVVAVLTLRRSRILSGLAFLLLSLFLLFLALSGSTNF